MGNQLATMTSDQMENYVSNGILVLAILGAILLFWLLFGQGGKQQQILRLVSDMGISVERNVLLSHFGDSPTKQFAYLNALERLVERGLLERTERHKQQFFGLTAQGREHLGMK